VIITIDGPAGSGKSTAARKLAARLGIPYLDTGAMYRVVTLAALHANADLNDGAALAKIAKTADYRLDLGPTHIRVTLDGHDVTEAIRSMHVSEHTRYVAAAPQVREVLVEKQREIGRTLGSMVTEGRDQGSVAFPDADAKFYLDADLHQRALRRYHELLAEGEVLDEEAVLRNVRERDRTDSERSVAPLRVPEGAMRIDASHLSVAQVIDQMLHHLHERGLIETIPHDEG
jgi:cytidylate kinase